MSFPPRGKQKTPSRCSPVTRAPTVATCREQTTSPSCQKPPVLTQPTHDLLHRARAMAHRIFHSGPKLCKALLVAHRHKERIIAESPGAMRRLQDPPFNRSLEFGKDFPRARNHHGTPETCGPIRARHIGKFGQQFPVIGPIIRSRAGITRRIHSRRSAQGIDFQSRVIREDKGVAELADCYRLQQRVLLKGCPGFLHFRGIWKR